MREIKTARCHYFLDDMNLRQGIYMSWHSNGGPRNARYYVDGEGHGEGKSWYDDGEIYSNEYYVAGHIVHDFIKNPLSDEEKVLLVLKYGGQLLPVGKNTQL